MYIFVKYFGDGPKYYVYKLINNDYEHSGQKDMTRISQKNSGENHATSTIDMNGIFYSAPEMALSAVPVGFLKKKARVQKAGYWGGGGASKCHLFATRTTRSSYINKLENMYNATFFRRT